MVCEVSGGLAARSVEETALSSEYVEVTCVGWDLSREFWAK